MVKYIYLVESNRTDQALAAFTVKYESQAWAEKMVELGHFESLNEVSRVRIKDGGSQALAQDIITCPWEKE